MKLTRYLLIIVTGAMISCAVFSENNVTRVGRYLIEKNGPKAAQIDALQETFLLTFPPVVYTIQDAMTYLLSNTSYKIAMKENQSFEAKSLLAHRLPLSDRKMGPMRVEDGLLVLAGSTYQLLVDPEHRLISFQLKKPYQELYLNS